MQYDFPPSTSAEEVTFILEGDVYSLLSSAVVGKFKTAWICGRFFDQSFIFRAPSSLVNFLSKTWILSETSRLR